MPNMAMGAFPGVVIECPDAGGLATFYGAILDWKVEIETDRAEVRADYGQVICFQQVEDYQPPSWPTQAQPRQMHLDISVGNLDAAEAAVLQLGATLDELQPGSTFRVFLNPAGHPFCPCPE